MTSDPLYRLLAWLSPAYPVGAFSYSHGVETAVEEGFIKDRASLVVWLESVLERGTGLVDGALFAATWRAVDGADWPAFDTIAERAAAWRGTSEMALESRQQGGSFLSITRAAWPHPDLDNAHERTGGELALPVAVAQRRPRRAPAPASWCCISTPITKSTRPNASAIRTAESPSLVKIGSTL